MSKESGWLLPGVINPETTCFQINIPNDPRHIAAFWGCLQLLAEWWNWERDEAHTAAQVARVWRSTLTQAHAAYIAANCAEDAMLRQNPNDPCQLQQSLDNGQTWTLAFDYGLCYPPYIKQILRQTDIILSDIRRDQTPIQININAPITTWIFSDGDTDAEVTERLQALCWASHRVVDMACELLIAAFQNEIDQLNLAEVVLGLAAIIAGALGVSLFSAIGIAIGIAALEARESMISSDVAKLSDVDLREFLSCALFISLQAKQVTVAAFASAFDVDVTCATADEQRVYELFRLLLANPNAAQDMYVAYVDIVGDARSAFKSGLLNATCVCDTRTWEYCLPLDVWFAMSESISPVIYSCTGLGSHPDTSALDTAFGAPFWASGVSEGFMVMDRRFRLYVPSGTTVTYIGYHYIYKLSGPGNTDGWAKRIEVNGTCAWWTSFAPSEINVSSLTISGEEMTVEVAMQNSGGASADMLGITYIKIQGTGVPLFGICDNCPT